MLLALHLWEPEYVYYNFLQRRAIGSNVRFARTDGGAAFGGKCQKQMLYHGSSKVALVIIGL